MVKVPTVINPSTSPTALVQRNLQAPGVDFSQIDRGIGKLSQAAAQFAENDSKRQLFDLNKRFMEEANLRSEDYDTRVKETPLGALGFADHVNKVYTTLDKEIVREYRDQGYDEDALHEFSLRLRNLTGNYFGQALTWQTESFGRKADEDLASSAGSISRYVNINPDGYESGKAEYLNQNKLLEGSLDAVRLSQFAERDLRSIRQAAGDAYALVNPRKVVEALAPHLLQQPGASGPRSSTNPWGNVAVQVADKWGIDPLELGALFSFESSFDPNRRNKTRHLGLIQFGEAEQRKYGISEGATPEQWVTAIDRFFSDRGLKPGDPIERVYATVLTGNPDGNIDKPDSNGTTVRNAIPRILREHKAVAAKIIGDITAPVVDTRLPAERQLLTGITVLDDMSGEEQLRVLARARSEMNQSTADLKARVQVQVDNQITALQNGLTPGPMPAPEDLEAAYGPVGAEQVRGTIDAARSAGTFAQSIKTQSAEAVNASLEALRPRDTSSPTYTKEAAGYTAAVRARDENFAQRNADPAAYVFANYPRVLQKLQAGASQEAYAAMDEAYNQLGIPENQRFYASKSQMEAIGRQYKVTSGEGKLAMLEGLASEMGWSRAGRTIGRGVGEEVVKDFVLYSTLRQLPNYRSTFARVMEGREIIKIDSARRPSERVVANAFGNALKSTINNLGPELSQLYNETTAALYVKDGGQTSNQALSDSSLYKKALREALGGDPNNPDTGIVNKAQGNARDWTILPPGVTGKQFDNWLEGLSPGDLTRLSVNGHQPRDTSNRHLPLQTIIDEGVFVMMAPGVYSIKLGSDGKFVGDGRGRAFELRLDKGRMGIR